MNDTLLRLGMGVGVQWGEGGGGGRVVSTLLLMPALYGAVVTLWWEVSRTRDVFIFSHFKNWILSYRFPVTFFGFRPVSTLRLSSLRYR